MERLVFYWSELLGEVLELPEWLLSKKELKICQEWPQR